MICKNYFLEAWRAAGRTPSEPCRSHQYRKIELSCRKMLLIINSLKQDSAAWSVYFHLRQTAGVRLWSAALKEDGGEELDAGLHSSSLFGEEERRGRPTDSRCQVFILKLYSSTFCSSFSGSSNHLPSASTNCCPKVCVPDGSTSPSSVTEPTDFNWAEAVFHTENHL